MKYILFLFLSFLISIAYSQTRYTSTQIKELASQMNSALKGMSFEGGIIGGRCYVEGRRINIVYEVPESWFANVNGKQDLLKTLIANGSAKKFSDGEIDVGFFYYRNNRLVTKVLFSHKELFLELNQLGDYISLKDHKKAKGVNLKLKSPNGWNVLEGDRPNIVIKFTKDENSFLVLINELPTFFTKSQAEELLADKEFTSDLLSAQPFEEIETIDAFNIKIDRYPGHLIKFKGKLKRAGYEFDLYMNYLWVIYEDRIINFGASGNLDNADKIDYIFLSIINSVVFPDQY